MKRLLVLPAAVLALAAGPAAAQTPPEGAYRDLWCGLAFGIAMKSAPFTDEDVAAARAAGDAATEEQLQLIEQADVRDQFMEGGAMLVDKATASYKQAGFTDEAFATVQTDLSPKVETQITGTGSDAEFTFEECAALLPGGDPTAQPSG